MRIIHLLRRILPLARLPRFRVFIISITTCITHLRLASAFLFRRDLLATSHVIITNRTLISVLTCVRVSCCGCRGETLILNTPHPLNALRFRWRLRTSSS